MRWSFLAYFIVSSCFCLCLDPANVWYLVSWLKGGKNVSRAISLMMVLEMLAFSPFSQLIQLVAREHFIIQSHCESCKSYTWSLFTVFELVLNHNYLEFLCLYPVTVLISSHGKEQIVLPVIISCFSCQLWYLYKSWHDKVRADVFL